MQVVDFPAQNTSIHTPNRSVVVVHCHNPQISNYTMYSSCSHTNDKIMVLPLPSFLGGEMNSRFSVMQMENFAPLRTLEIFQREHQEVVIAIAMTLFGPLFISFRRPIRDTLMQDMLCYVYCRSGNMIPGSLRP